MPAKRVPKHESVDLASIKPTDEELETVRQIVAGDPKIKKAKMASMSHYLKLFPDDKASNSRGDSRTEYMELFLVHQMRQKAGATLTSTFSTEANQHRFTDLHWWSEETMDKNLGQEFAKHWRESKLVPSKPNSLTGSTDPKHLEWGVPQNWERLQESDLRRLMIEHQSEDADESDMKLVLDASVFNRPADESAGGATSSGADASTGPTQMAKLAASIKALRDEPEKHARKYNDMSLALKRVLGQAEAKAAKEKYMLPFVEDIKACTKRTEKLEKTFTKMLTEEVEDKEFPKLIEIVKAVDEQYKELQEWCPKFGVSLTGTAKTPKRKRAKGN
jgi:hypothetical protein